MILCVRFESGTFPSWVVKHAEACDIAGKVDPKLALLAEAESDAECFSDW